MRAFNKWQNKIQLHQVDSGTWKQHFKLAMMHRQILQITHTVCQSLCPPGPFWICATLVFVIAICGNISNFLVYLGKPQYKYVPEFQKGECHITFFKGKIKHRIKLTAALSKTQSNRY